MAKLTTKEIIDSISEMTILEVKELVDAMKETFGVDPSAVAVAAAPAEAKGLADNGGNIKENVSADEANDIKAKLEEAGATVELV